MERQRTGTAERDMTPHDPAFLERLLADTRFAPLWLALRVALGWLLLEAGWLRLQHLAGPGDPLAVGLTLSGIALILGVLTGPAAFLGGCLGVGFWAGEGVLPIALRFAAVIWLILAWKTAGWIGIDRWLLPLLGLPWRGGELLRGRTAHERGTSDRRHL